MVYSINLAEVHKWLAAHLPAAPKQTTILRIAAGAIAVSAAAAALYYASGQTVSLAAGKEICDLAVVDKIKPLLSAGAVAVQNMYFAAVMAVSSPTLLPLNPEWRAVTPSVNIHSAIEEKITACNKTREACNALNFAINKRMDVKELSTAYDEMIIAYDTFNNNQHVEDAALFYEMKNEVYARLNHFWKIAKTAGLEPDREFVPVPAKS